MRKSKKVYIISVLVILIIIIGLFASPGYVNASYLKRCIAWGPSDVEDYKRLPYHVVNNGTNIFNFKKNAQDDIIAALSKDMEYKYKGQAKQIGDIDKFLQDTNTTAFIVIKDDNILYEKYFNGYSRNSINTSFSVAKSFVSALIGIAIDEGYIKSVDEPITNYIPELSDKGFDKVTIKNLLSMSSGIKYVEYPLPTGDDTKTYYSTGLRKLAIEEVNLKDPIGQYFHYNNYHPLLLGLILERATHKSVAEYLEEKIWKPLGMEYPASWTIDSIESGFEKMESGINARAIDFAKFGRLFLNKGNWNGKQIISEKWVTESTKADFTQDREYYKNAWFYKEDVYYKYFWYSYPRGESDYDFFAAGHLSQYIYVCPQKKLIILRNGEDDGKVDYWSEVLHNLSNKL